MEWPEDFIMFAATMENQIGVDVASMSFTQPAPVFELAGVQEPDNAVSGGENTPLEPMTLTAYGISSTLKGTMTYTQMKTLLDRIYAQKDVTKLDSLDVSYDNTSGLLLGDLTLSKYFITGRDIPEHSPVIPYASIGNDHLMG